MIHNSKQLAGIESSAKEKALIDLFVTQMIDEIIADRKASEIIAKWHHSHGEEWLSSEQSMKAALLYRDGGLVMASESLVS